MRVRIYERLEPRRRAGLPAFRSGELLARLVDDVDSIQDLLLRVLPAFAIAVIVGLLAVAIEIPDAARGGGDPGGPHWRSRSLRSRGLPARLAARSAAREAGSTRRAVRVRSWSCSLGAPELMVNGTLDRGARAHIGSRRRARLASRGPADARRGSGRALRALLSGLAMWGSLTVGVAAVASGRIDGVLLAGLALVPLAAFELISPVPAATQALEGVRSSRRASAGGARGAGPRQGPRPPTGTRLGTRLATRAWPAGPPSRPGALGAEQRRSRPGPSVRAWRWSARAAQARRRSRGALLRFLPYPRLDRPGRHRDRRARRRGRPRGSSASWPRTPTCSTPRSRRT